VLAVLPALRLVVVVLVVVVPLEALPGQIQIVGLRLRSIPHAFIRGERRP
jgi:hypothetical protein